jgi:hypothetical protein
MSIVLNNFKATKDTSLIYWESLINIWQIWIEYKYMVGKIDEMRRKSKKYKVISPYI